jgi:hypothetical protein
MGGFCDLRVFVASCEIILPHEGTKTRRRSECAADVLRLLGHNMPPVGKVGFAE